MEKQDLKALKQELNSLIATATRATKTIDKILGAKNVLSGVTPRMMERALEEAHKDPLGRKRK